MNDNLTVQRVSRLPSSNDFTSHVRGCIDKMGRTGRPFFIVILKFNNFEKFCRKRPQDIVRRFINETTHAIRKAVHPSQFVGCFEDGIGLVFDAVDPGHVDSITTRLIRIIENTIRVGKYNDFSTQWSEIISQFLYPHNPPIISPKIGWAIFPRDGDNVGSLLKRAQIHLVQHNKD